ncbi:MAG: hypothetical protein JKX70_04410 [Phycisphaerales bacterium]|nr:hypothetical protein [Phycisphaerales bacterium]
MAINNGVLAVAANAELTEFAYGSVHLFDIATQTETLRLIPDDDYFGNGFGACIDIDDGVVAVGAVVYSVNSDGMDLQVSDGAVYLFDAITGEQIRKFTQPTNDFRGIFGYSVAVKDGILAVGAPFCDDSHAICNSHSPPQVFGGYVYLYDVNTGAQLMRVSTNDGMSEDSFGVSVSMDNGRLAVGAPFQDGGGALYVFSLANGVQLRRYQPEGISSDYAFGISVSSSGDRVAVGAVKGTITQDRVYIYNTVTEGEIVITSPPGTFGTFFGVSVAFDNDIVVIGAEKADDDSGETSPGRAYMYNATTGLFVTELSAAGVGDGDDYGSSVAIEGLYTAVGAEDYRTSAPNKPPNNAAAYLFFTFAGTEIAKIVPDEENLVLENFGYATAAGEGVVVISANKNDDRGENAGSAYLFDASNGSRLATYLPDAGTDNGNFGYSLDYDNAIVAVGARDESGRGAAYIFGAFTGDRLRKITPADAQAGDFFGSSIGLDTQFNGGVVAIGASQDDDQGDGAGAVYLFNPFNGIQLNKLYADDALNGDAFGNVLAVDNGLLAVGSPLNDDLGSSSGSAYIFDMATGNQLFKLLPNDGLAGDSFGSSIAIHDGIVAVGAWQRDDLGGSSGAVYIFDAATGNQLHKFLPDDGAADDRFGFSVSISKGVVLIGANRDDINGTSSGSAYIFGATSGNQLYKLAPFEGNAQDNFGRSVSIHNNTIGIGAIGNDDLGFNAGIAYSFSVPADICPADLTGDRVVNFFDVAEFLQLFAAEDPAADMTNDGMFNFFDVAAFLTAYAASCP